jgi:hypothetical protein
VMDVAPTSNHLPTPSASMRSASKRWTDSFRAFSDWQRLALNVQMEARVAIQ